MQELIYPHPCADEHLINTQPAFIGYNTFKMRGKYGKPVLHKGMSAV